MSIEGNAVAEEGTPTYVTRFDGVRVPATDYRPVWLGSLADDVTIEGSAMNGVVLGAEAVRSIVTYIRTLYDNQEFNFAGPYGENGFLEGLHRPGPRRAIGQRRPGHPQRRRSGPAHRGQLPAPDHTAAVVPADRRALRRHPHGEHFASTAPG